MPGLERFLESCSSRKYGPSFGCGRSPAFPNLPAREAHVGASRPKIRKPASYPRRRLLRKRGTPEIPRAFFMPGTPSTAPSCGVSRLGEPTASVPQPRPAMSSIRYSCSAPFLRFPGAPSRRVAGCAGDNPVRRGARPVAKETLVAKVRGATLACSVIHSGVVEVGGQKVVR